MGFYSKYLFPRLLDWSLRAPEVGEQRGLALAPASGRVLEIGFGTGLNLRHYPESVDALIAVDRESMLKDRVEKRIRESGLKVEQFQLDAGGRLPFDDSSFDSVVTTFTLCSIANVGPALDEIQRVLKPGGKYIFLEHGRSDDPGIARRQDLLNPLQKLVAGGCNINRPIANLIEGSGLKVSSLDRFMMPNTPKILAGMYRGVAIR